jgi:hypothetical protein
MINALVIALFGAAFVVEYLIRERELLHPYLILLPELMSAIAMVVVLARLTAGARISLDGRYAGFIVALLLTIVVGFVVQDVPAGAAVAGIRAHLKFLPFFLLPMVYRFSSSELRVQFLLLLVLLLGEAPLALYQRFIEYADMMQTGDVVRGTATTSSALSMLMMCGIAAVVSLYLRGLIRFTTVIVVMGVFVLPTTLNETKATLLLLPLAVLVPALVMPRGSRAVSRLLPVAALGAVAMIAFIAVYDSLIRYSPTGEPIAQFVGETSYLRYLYSGAADEGANYIGRFDSLEFALQGIGRDPLTAAFGLGAGNVSTSFLPQFDGEYAAYYDRYGVGMTQMTNLLWQVGFVGVVAYLSLYYFVLGDARALARSGGTDALLGQIWVGVTLIMIFALIYKSTFAMNELGYPFWFYSGVVAARVAELRRAWRVQRFRTGADTVGNAAMQAQG